MNLGKDIKSARESKEKLKNKVAPSVVCQHILGSYSPITVFRYKLPPNPANDGNMYCCATCSLEATGKQLNANLFMLKRAFEFQKKVKTLIEK